MKAAVSILFFALLVISCDSPSRDDILLSGPPGEKYTIDYNREYGLFLISYNDVSDTISLYDNWNYALYRYRQSSAELAVTSTYDEFMSSEWNCLPGSEANYQLVNSFPDSVFSSDQSPTFCDCITESGDYDLTSVRCEEKFQVFRTGYNDSIQWYYNFYKDICTNQVADTVSFTAYKDSTLTKAKRAELKARRQRAIQDSIDNIGPKRQCNAQVWIPRHQRSSEYRVYEQCRSYTGHVSGKCGTHR